MKPYHKPRGWIRFAVGEASAGRKEKLRNWHLCVLTWHGPRRRRLPTDAPACNVAAPVSCILSASLGLCSRFCPLGFTGVLACICMSCETIDSGKHGNSIYLLDQKKSRLCAARLALAIAIGVDEGNGAAQVDSYDQLVNCARLLKQESALASNVGPVLEDSSRQPILMGSSEQMGASLLQACHVDASVDQSKHLFQWRLLAKPRGRCVLRPPLLGPASLTRTTADLMQWFRTRHLEGLLQNFEETNPSLNLETLDNMLAFVLRMQFQRRDSQSTTSWVSNGWPR